MIEKMRQPVTVLTDYFLAIECFVFAVLMLKQDPTQHSVRFWAAAFVTTAIAAVAGGTYHGWRHQFDDLVRITLWKVTVYAIGFTTALMFAATAFAVLDGWLRELLLMLAILQFLFYAAWMARRDDFRYVVLNYLPTLLLMLAMYAGAALVLNTRASWWISSGIGVSLWAAGVQRSDVVLHRHVTANDIYHLLQMFAMYLLYRGGLLMHDRAH